MNAPANVGVVNLSTVIDRMKERQEWEVRLKALESALVDDSKTELRVQRNEKVSMEAQALEQIAALRMLFGSKAVDVSEKLLVQLDNDRSLAAPAGTTPATPAAPR